MYWFEFGGNQIGRLFMEGPEAEEFPKWRLIAKYKSEFSCHFTLVHVNGSAGILTGSDINLKGLAINTWYLLGGIGSNCL